VTRPLSQNQKTFNKVIRHARKQRAKSITPNGVQDRCLYRGPNGLMCFVGPLIPNKRYRPEMEDHPLCADGGQNMVTNLMRELGHDLNLCQHLQGIHDAFPVSEWEEKFQEVAREFGLVMPKK
jgi:hypothetical protein